jgi:hypothetical protein
MLCKELGVSGWDIKSFKHADQIAKKATKEKGEPFIATDEGSHTSPRYNVMKMYKVGDKISYGFNGDTYPDGYVARISKNLKVITSTTGSKYYRLRKSGSWRKEGTWFIGPGHVFEQNPSF